MQITAVSFANHRYGLPKIFGNLVTMTTRPTKADYKRLGAVVEHRRWRDLNLRQDQLPHGPSTTTMTDIEGGKKVSDLSYRKLERSLGWEARSVDAVLAGGEPTLTPPPPPLRKAEPVPVTLKTSGNIEFAIDNIISTTHMVDMLGDGLSPNGVSARAWSALLRAAFRMSAEAAISLGVSLRGDTNGHQLSEVAAWLETYSRGLSRLTEAVNRLHAIVSAAIGSDSDGLTEEENDALPSDPSAESDASTEAGEVEEEDRAGSPDESQVSLPGGGLPGAVTEAARNLHVEDCDQGGEQAR